MCIGVEGFPTVAVVSLLLAGCAADVTASNSGTGWVEPAWMSQMRQEQEIFERSMTSCFDQHGVESRIALGGGVTTPGPVDDSAEVLSHLYAVWMECHEQIGLPSMWLMAPDEEAYSMMLDVRECIMYFGFEVDEPPAFAVWAEQVHPWNPMASLIHTLPTEELAPVMDTCLQVGPGRIIVSSQ